MNSIKDIFSAAVEAGASDVHLAADMPPIARIDGQLVSLVKEPKTSEQVKKIVFAILDENQTEDFDRERELDFSHEIEGLGRFRVNLHWERGHVGLVARVISAHIPTMEEILMPEIAYKLARLHEGLILVTGPAGSGKSTTLAAMVNLINHERNAHVVTLEDPIEFVYQNEKSLIKQRELGSDLLTFQSGLKRVLRQDPNVVMVGEMRDLETTAATLTLAETGHLVLATLHTYSAPQSIDRIIDIFPPNQQQQVRLQLSISLRGVMTQRLLPKVGGGRVAAREILINNNAVSSLIRQNNITQISSVIQTGARDGMISMEKAVSNLVKDGLIAKEIADRYVAK